MISVGKLNGQIRHICINITDANKHLGIQASKYWISYLKMLMWVSVQCCQLHLFDLSCMFTIQMCTVSHLPHHYIRVGVWIFGSKFICLLLRIQPLSEERLTKLVEYLIPAAVQQVCLSPVDSLAQQTTVARLLTPNRATHSGATLLPVRLSSLSLSHRLLPTLPDNLRTVT